ncbi:MAG: S8 family peptidase [Desulfobacterales bacterium]|nr:S8 family peptidase [Desulfobacterales bacterium]
MKKNSSLKIALIASMLVWLVFIGLAWAQNQPFEDQSRQLPYASDRILVKFKPLTHESVKVFVHQWYGGRVIDIIPGLDVHVVQIPEKKIREKLRAYLREPWIEYAEPDFVAHAFLEPNDPDFESQWGPIQIHAPEAWDITTASPEVRIAVCDTGIDQNHADLLGKIVANKNFTSSRSIDDKFGHGTHVAGIAAAVSNNGRGVAGVGFRSSLMNVKVLGDDGSGYYSWVAKGIIWAADHGAKVINLSLGGPAGSGTLQNAVNYAWGKGCVIVAAAGNDGNGNPSYPAYYDNCIAVAATDPNDSKATFSNHGFWVDVAAPGVDIYSTLPNHKNQMGPRNYGTLSGTSMAAPHVAGVAALVWATDFGTSNAAVRARIEDKADSIGSIGLNYDIDRLNAFRAVWELP